MPSSISHRSPESRQFTDEFVREHISPAPAVTFLRIINQSEKTPILSEDILSRESSISSFAFWHRVESLCEALCNVNLFRRVEEIYVSPQSASENSISDKYPLESYVGSMTRAAHIKDVMRIAVQDLSERHKRGELTFDGPVTREDILYTVFASWAHDIAVFAQSHLTQDSLVRTGVKVDHDVSLIYAISCDEVKAVLESVGLNHKEAVASALCPQFLSLSPQDRAEENEISQKQLLNLIKKDPVNARRYKLSPESFESVLNFDPNHEDRNIIDSPKVAIRSALAHELYDIAYSRTDISQSVKHEVWAASLLKNGNLGRSFNGARLLARGEHDLARNQGNGPLFKPIYFSELPTQLQAKLASGGSPPSGSLFIGQVANGKKTRGGASTYQVLMEIKGNEKIIRAIARGRREEQQFHPSEGLTRVKIHKSISRFNELLRSTRPLGNGAFEITHINPLIRVILSLGDYQTHFVGSMHSLVGVGFYEKANTLAQPPVSPLVQLYGTHLDVTSHYLKRHRVAEARGTGSFYRILSYLHPHSTVSGPSWFGPDAPNSEELDKTLNELKVLGKELEAEVRRKSNRNDFEVITAMSPPVKKVFPLELTKTAVDELCQRLSGGDKPQVVDGAVIYTRRSRSERDLFSLSLKIYVNVPSTASAEDICQALTTETNVELHYKLHRGFVFAVPNRLLRFVVEDRDVWSWFQQRQLEILASAKFNNGRGISYTHSVQFFPE